MTRVLLDTHALLWVLGEHRRLLPAPPRESAGGLGYGSALQRRQHRGVAIKTALGRADFAAGPEEIAAAVRDGLAELPVRSAMGPLRAERPSAFSPIRGIAARFAALVARLPLHHRDPFDRLLVAQAVAEPARLLTADPQLPPYSDPVTPIA